MKPELFGHVALLLDLDEFELKIGDIATVVDFVEHPDGGEEGCVLEVFNAVGESIHVITVPLSAVSPVTADDVLSVRRRAAV